MGYRLYGLAFIGLKLTVWGLVLDVSRNWLFFNRTFFRLPEYWLEDLGFRVRGLTARVRGFESCLEAA